MVSDPTIEKVTTIIVIGTIVISGLFLAPGNNEVYIIAVAAIAGIAGFTFPTGFYQQKPKE